MTNLPEKTPNPSAIPAGIPGDALASTFPGALPTCAPDALLLIDRAELNRHLADNLKGVLAVSVWHEFNKAFDLLQPTPALN